MTTNSESGAPVASLIGCVFVGTSLDGFIARENGDFDWLVAAGDAIGETGYDEFFASVDALVVGRATFDTVRGFVDWPYAGKRVLVLSRTLLRSFDVESEPDATAHATLDDVIATLVAEGHRRVYVDGGRTIQSFLRAGLIREITITRAPVLLGAGIPLFGPLDGDVQLRHVGTRELGAGFTQSSYEVLRSS
ncbi:dihydrofolate reductase [Cryobacterium adonitolivorans]|uniref:Dihydrofolate reductase n=1 Tax=Cryobacterium adonitolivorans TaxID=1259189 RepID=A0A4R8W8I9_9MICO|nr:dihydrofolate reductase family protein [Cryobacterium adonitolivorans]TFC01590.1 dihydrofolate reductase [Cryobacterium adonitolivorans]